MASSIYFKNVFSGGQISPKMRRMVSSEIYQTSAKKLYNVVPMSTGGVTLRPGMKSLLKNMADYVRIIPFVLASDDFYLVALKPNQMDILRFGDTDDPDEIVETPVCTYTTKYPSADVINEIMFVQDYEHLFLCHEDYPPLVVLQNSLNDFTPGELKLEEKTAAEDVTEDDGTIKTYSTYDYDGFCTEAGHYPCGCAYIAGKLVFFATELNKYTIWFSRPFEYDNFQITEYYSELDEEGTMDDYLKALTNDGTVTTYYDANGNDITASVKTSGSEDSATTKKVVITSASTSGFSTITTTEYVKIYSDEEQSQWSWSANTVTTDYTMNVESKTSWQTQVTDDCAMELEVGSDRNDIICWVAQSENIYVGTASSEYMMDKDITPTTASIQKIASFGSMRHIQPALGNNNIYYAQSGGKSIRTIKLGYYGHEYNNVTQYCADVFEEHKIKGMAWQRVPEPRLYIWFEDGTMAVLVDDGAGNVRALAQWETNGKVLSVAILDIEDGQAVYALVERTIDGVTDRYIERFVDGLYTDGAAEDAIEADIVTNMINSSEVIAMSKRINQYYVDSYGTRFTVGQEGQTLREPPNWSADTELYAINAGNMNTKNFYVEMKNFPKEAFTILSVEATVEIS